ncbi:MAG: hypothetical protein N2515_03475 [Deltaproteobacteria bacterium]|nr:hypothetical protein [Deltaproteobacteria bacterium]
MNALCPKDPSFHLENRLDSASCPECERELNALKEACMLANGTRLIVVQGPRLSSETEANSATLFDGSNGLLLVAQWFGSGHGRPWENAFAFSIGLLRCFA